MYKYQHVIENLNCKDTQGLLADMSVVIVQPKLDGSNCQMYVEDGELIITGRKRILSPESDNHNCYKTLIKLEKYKRFFKEFPTVKLIGEWLIKRNHIQYQDEAYNKFYVFDGIKLGSEYEDEGGHTVAEYVNYTLLSQLLESYQIEHVPFVEAQTPFFGFDLFTGPINFNNFPAFRYLLKDDAPGGEGIVLKNYNYRNYYGRINWGKIINRDVYKKRPPRPPKEIIDRTPEIKFVDGNLTDHLLDKCFHKINDEHEFTCKDIGTYIKVCQNEFYEDFSKMADITNYKAINQLVAQAALDYVRRNKYA